VSFEATFVVPTSAEDGVLEALRRFYPELPIPAPVPAAVRSEPLALQLGLAESAA
jgi:hypothetical protein